MSRQPAGAGTPPSSSGPFWAKEKMKILSNNLREMAEHVEALLTKGCQVDPVTADLLWSIAGRLRYPANHACQSRFGTTLLYFDHFLQLWRHYSQPTLPSLTPDNGHTP